MPDLSDTSLRQEPRPLKALDGILHDWHLEAVGEVLRIEEP